MDTALIERGVDPARFERGRCLLEDGKVLSLDTDHYVVICQDPDVKKREDMKDYVVTLYDIDPRHWECECGDHIWRGLICKHMIAVYLFITQQ